MRFYINFKDFLYFFNWW